MGGMYIKNIRKIDGSKIVAGTSSFLRVVFVARAISVHFITCWKERGPTSHKRYNSAQKSCGCGSSACA